MKYPQQIINAFEVTNLIRDYHLALRIKRQKEALEKMNQALAIRIEEGYQYGFSTGGMPLINCLMNCNADFGIAKTVNDFERKPDTQVWELKEVLTLNKVKINQSETTQVN